VRFVARKAVGYSMRERMAPVHYEREMASRQIARSIKGWRAENERQQAGYRADIPQEGGSGLPGGLKNKMESQLGADLSGVKIHTGGASAQAAEELGARAFTVGQDVHFGGGEFKPGTKEGDRLIAHELTHTVQGARSGVQRKADSDAHPGEADAVSHPDEPAEKEADHVADKVADHLHGAEASPAAAPGAPTQKAPVVGAKLAISATRAPDVIFRDPKSGAAPKAAPAAAPAAVGGAAPAKTPEQQLGDAIAARDAAKVTQLATTDPLRAKVIDGAKGDAAFLEALVNQNRATWAKPVLGVALASGNGGLIKKVASDLPSKTAAVKEAIAQSKAGLLLTTIGTGGEAEWKTATNAVDYDTLVGATGTPISIKQIQDGVWTLWGDGAGRNPASARMTFSHLFSAQIAAPGDTSVTWPGGTSSNPGTPPVTFAWRTVYMPVKPDDNAMKLLLTAVKPIPVGQVNLSKIAFVPQTKQQWQQTAPTPGPWTDQTDATGKVTTTAIGTSYYLANCNSIVIRSTAAGVVDTTAIGKAVDNAPIAVGGGSSPNLSFFMNHARHEIGHAVGAKSFKGVGEAGDDFAKVFGGWAPSSKAGIIAAYWTKKGVTEIDWSKLGGKAKEKINDADVADWLAGYIETGDQPAGNAVTRLPGDKALKLPILAARYGNEQLFKYFMAIGGLTPKKDNAYMFPGFVPSGGEVHIWCTRANPVGWTKYSTAAYTALHASHGWYSLASQKEMFAEIYTHKYSGGGVPAACNGKDPAAFFKALEESKDSDTLTNLGASAPPAPAAAGGEGGKGSAAPATPQKPPAASNPPALG
jgi:hypothetical protein